jgi:hypothetical protein
MKQPIQPIDTSESGTLRFHPNRIVRYLLDNGGIDLNAIAKLQFPREDRVQFAQLIGYSLSGFGELSYVDQADYDTAQELAGTPEKSDWQARSEGLESRLNAIRRGLRLTVPEAFEIHPDDLYPTGEYEPNE